MHKGVSICILKVSKNTLILIILFIIKKYMILFIIKDNKQFIISKYNIIILNPSCTLVQHTSLLFKP